MMKNHKLAQAFSDVSLGAFYTMLEYKANWNDKTVVKIDRFFPSSKTCNVCNYINQDLTLKDREWTCTNCKIHHNRDFNSALNILKEGLKIYSSGSYSVSLNEVTVKPKVCKDEVGSCVATKHKTKVFVSFG